MTYGAIALGVGVLLILLVAKGGYDAASGPAVIALIAMYICFLIAAYNYAESKGHSGALGVCCMIFGVIGVLILMNLTDKVRPVYRR